MKNIRNFSIIAHIDHGKSTLADRIIQLCGGLSDREMESQVLDSMALERERGITIKAQTASLQYKARNGEIYKLNLIDTPGHVDFSYEVSRSLSACEGALLVVDASQGVEAQTVANCYTALELGVEVVPVLNKIDLPSANPENAIAEIGDVIGIDATEAVRCSAKTGQGVEDVLEALIAQVPAPVGDPQAPLAALVLDSWFDPYVGVVVLTRVVQGTLKPKDAIRFMASGAQFLVERIGEFTPKASDRPTLSAGQVGFIIAGIKELKAARVGDTVTHVRNPASSPLPGFKEVKPQVFAGLYPIESNQYEALRESLEKLQLNDASLLYEPESSQALGMGFRCGFLGLLHMDIVQERLEREFGMNLITTAPTVIYEVVQRDEIVLDFFDRLKSLSRGYASMDYEFKEYAAADVVKIDMLINSTKVDALSLIVHRSQSQSRGREIAAKMREVIPRQMFDVAIQAAIGATIISRENIKAMRKNVLAKCYGGDITRKKKLLEKQKAGKKRMKQVGGVEIPQEAFLAILNLGE
ncbi:hypothetical protein BGZ81_004926 [Podila clonocystis]|nr:hypothetical protein BGZ81_004926 [Podila clonocystis]